MIQVTTKLLGGGGGGGGGGGNGGVVAGTMHIPPLSPNRGLPLLTSFLIPMCLKLIKIN